MCEVTRKNFAVKFEQLKQEIKESSFITIDAEFSGLLSKQEYKSSLFDTPEKRYDKLKNSVNDFIILQCGISIFRYNRDDSKYTCTPYNFYVFPRCLGSVDNKFKCQSSSFQFLCLYNFDFNKLFYEGISYLNKQDEKVLRQELMNDTLFRLTERNLFEYEEQLIQENCSKVAQWAASSDENNTEFILETNNNVVLNYFIHKELRYRFPGLWTFPSTSNKILVKKVLESERKKLEADPSNNKNLEEDVLDFILGFTKVIDLIVKSQKPIVGHNLLLDLMLIYKQFLSPLPNDYNEFKSAIMTVFPTVYDTKNISFELRSHLKKEECWATNGLKDLFEYFTIGKGTSICLFPPEVKISGEYLTSSKFHEAGYDSYCTGVCFLRLAYCLLSWDSVKQNFVSRCLPPTFTQLLSSVINMKNHVNVIRAHVDYINLSGPDPLSTRPPLIHVEAKGFKNVDILQITEMFAKFGNVDVMPIARRRALVAVGNHACAKDILQHYRRHNNYTISQYSFFKHSTTVRKVLWSSVLVTSMLYIVYYLRNEAR